MNQPAPTDPETAVTEAVLLFFREIGIQKETVNHLIAAGGLARCRNAMKKAIARTMRGRVHPDAMLEMLGPVPQLDAAARKW